jgi:hypothetical protein
MTKASCCIIPTRVGSYKIQSEKPICHIAVNILSKYILLFIIFLYSKLLNSSTPYFFGSRVEEREVGNEYRS